jgi:carbon storage regulator
MLVLTRKIGQRVAIGENVELTVLQVSGKRVRLGVTAPRAVAVHRAEVLCHVQNTELLLPELNEPVPVYQDAILQS